LSTTQAVIEFIKTRRIFDLIQAVDALGIDRRKVLRVLDKLTREGFLEITKTAYQRPIKDEVGPARRNPKFKRIQDISARKPARPECARDKIWRTLRHLRKATRSDLTRLTGCHPKTVEDYTLLLEQYGFIKAIGKTVNQEKVWLLINNDGPKRPKTTDRTKPKTSNVRKN